MGLPFECCKSRVGNSSIFQIAVSSLFLGCMNDGKRTEVTDRFDSFQHGILNFSTRPWIVFRSLLVVVSVIILQSNSPLLLAIIVPLFFLSLWLIDHEDLLSSLGIVASLMCHGGLVALLIGGCCCCWSESGSKVFVQWGSTHLTCFGKSSHAELEPRAIQQDLSSSTQTSVYDSSRQQGASLSP